MTQKFYINENGEFVGSWDGVEPEDTNLIEVADAPPGDGYAWSFSASTWQMTSAAQKSAVSAQRYEVETGGFAWNGFYIDTERDSQAKINSAWAAARDGFRAEGSVWKCLDLSSQEVVARPTSNEEMIDIGRKAFLYVQKCYDREGELLAAIDAGNYTEAMLKVGWAP